MAVGEDGADDIEDSKLFPKLVTTEIESNIHLAVKGSSFFNMTYWRRSHSLFEKFKNCDRSATLLPYLHRNFLETISAFGGILPYAGTLNSAQELEAGAGVLQFFTIMNWKKYQVLENLQVE